MLLEQELWSKPNLYPLPTMAIQRWKGCPISFCCADEIFPLVFHCLLSPFISHRGLLPLTSIGLLHASVSLGQADRVAKGTSVEQKGRRSKNILPSRLIGWFISLSLIHKYTYIRANLSFDFLPTVDAFLILYV